MKSSGCRRCDFDTQFENPATEVGGRRVTIRYLGSPQWLRLCARASQTDLQMAMVQKFTPCPNMLSDWLELDLSVSLCYV